MTSQTVPREYEAHDGRPVQFSLRMTTSTSEQIRAIEEAEVRSRNYVINELLVEALRARKRKNARTKTR